MKLTADIIKRYTSRYYTALKKFKHHQADNEGTTETAFKHLLHNIAIDLNLTLVKTTESLAKKNIIPDGIIKDDSFHKIGVWEAKDTQDDLDDEIYKKLKKGYPRENTIFEDTSIAVLYQDGSEFNRYNLTKEDELIELLLQFFNYKEPVYEQFRQAVEKFKQNINRLAEDFQSIIHKAKKVNSDFKNAIDEFLEVCKQSFHRDISEVDVEDMLIQHLLTERIFRKVFDNTDFSSKNVIAVQLEKLISILTKHAFNRAKFFEHTNQYYQAIEEEAAQFDDFTEKQHFLNKIYEAFFQSYSKKNADKNGIVYTPQSIVKFMVKFTDSVLQEEFGKTLSDKGVNIIDPCTGTGNFVMEILRNIKTEQLPYKYKNEIFANELMLLPYYVASANIEHFYYEATKKYEPFENIVFTDTLELIEDPRKKQEQTKLDFFFNEANSERAKRQIETDLFVIIGNPPYNASQDNENENNKNTKNEIIDGRIAETYAKESNAQLKNKLYDPYVKFFRWASDRLNKQNGVVCFITNNSFISDIQFDGMRKLLLKDFNRIYHYDLDGDVYTTPNITGTKHNVFGIKLGVGITFLVRNSKYTDSKIFYRDIERHIIKEEKYHVIDEFREECRNLTDLDWTEGYLDSSNNYTFNAEQIEVAREYEKFILLFDESNKEGIFLNKYPGLSTNRTEWVYNFSKYNLEQNIKSTIKFYNEEVVRLTDYIKEKHIKDVNKINLDNFVRNDDAKIKWSLGLKNKLKGLHKATFNSKDIEFSLIRPFTKRYFYHNRALVDRPSNYKQLLSVDNLFLCTNGRGQQKGFSTLMTNLAPEIQTVYNAQVFPFWDVFEVKKNDRVELKTKLNISDWAVETFRKKCKNDKIKAENIFHYIYGIFHHPNFTSYFENYLKISSPRVPLLSKHFDTISEIGKKLSQLHLNYEKAKETPLKPTKETLKYLKTKKKIDYNIETLKISRDKLLLTYNKELEFFIPKEAWGYKVNGRTPLEWIVDQYKYYDTTTDEIIKLMNRCITVTIESVTLINRLSKLKM